MFAEKINQLVGAWEKQELEVNWYRFEFNEIFLIIQIFIFKAPNGIVSAQLYLELLAAYLYQDDL